MNCQITAIRYGLTDQRASNYFAIWDPPILHGRDASESRFFAVQVLPFRGVDPSLLTRFVLIGGALGTARTSTEDVLRRFIDVFRDQGCPRAPQNPSRRS